MAERTAEAIQVALVQHRLRTIETQITELVDVVREVQGRLERVNEHPNRTYTAIAAEVQNEIVTKLANMQLGELLVTAAEADVFRMKEE
jgi:hypothetical protein